MDQEMIRKAVEVVLQAAPGARVIVFGSQATSQADERSDLDLLVIEPQVDDPFGEMVRLSEALGRLLIPADVAVVSEREFEIWRETPNTLMYRAAREGKVYGQVP